MRGAALGLEMGLMEVMEVADPPTRQLPVVDAMRFLCSDTLISSIWKWKTLMQATANNSSEDC